MKWLSWLIGAAFVVAWSSGFVGATLADATDAGVWQVLAWRYLITAALLIGVCFLLPSARQAIRSLRVRDLLQQGVLALLAHTVFLGGVFLAARNGLDAGLSAVVCALQPLLVAAIGSRAFKDRIRPWQWAGMVLALGGVALSVGGIGTDGLGSVVLVTASLLGLSAAAVLERAWQPTVPVLVSLTIQVTIAAVVFFTAAMLIGGLSTDVSPAFVLAIGWLVLISGLGGYAAFTWCLRHVGATATSTLLYLTAPVTMLWGWMMFAQQPAALQWAGLLIVLIGVTLAMHSGRRHAGKIQRQSVPSSAFRGH